MTSCLSKRPNAIHLDSESKKEEILRELLISFCDIQQHILHSMEENNFKDKKILTLLMVHGLNTSNVGW